jgi:excisionase family DNA binding protein
MEIRDFDVYTTEEAQSYLKVSNSTMMRMIKKGLIRAAKVGKQYRILGKELLRVVSPKLEDKVGKLYNKGRKWVHEGIDTEEESITGGSKK